MSVRSSEGYHATKTNNTHTVALPTKQCNRIKPKWPWWMSCKLFLFVETYVRRARSVRCWSSGSAASPPFRRTRLATSTSFWTMTAATTADGV